MQVLNRHGKCKQTTVELVGNVVSAEVEGNGRCVHSCTCVGQMQDDDRRLQADHPRALRMGEASAEAVSLDISSMFVRVLSELYYCCTCSGTHVSFSFSSSAVAPWDNWDLWRISSSHRDDVLSDREDWLSVRECEERWRN